MKQDKKQELRNNTIDQMQKKADQITNDLVKINLDFKMGKIKNVRSMKALKNERAVIKTVIAEKKLEESLKTQ